MAGPSGRHFPVLGGGIQGSGWGIDDEEHLRRILRSYFAYYHESRTHLSLDKDCPVPRAVEPPMGDVVAFPQVGGLHHRYARRAA